MLSAVSGHGDQFVQYPHLSRGFRCTVLLANRRQEFLPVVMLIRTSSARSRRTGPAGSTFGEATGGSSKQVARPVEGLDFPVGVRCKVGS